VFLGFFLVFWVLGFLDFFGIFGIFGFSIQRGQVHSLILNDPSNCFVEKGQVHCLIPMDQSDCFVVVASHLDFGGLPRFKFGIICRFLRFLRVLK